MYCVHLLQVLARICLTESEFQRVLTSIIDLFTADGRLLETRGSLIIRKLCVLLNAKSIYMALAAVLQSKLTAAFIANYLESACVDAVFETRCKLHRVQLLSTVHSAVSLLHSQLICTVCYCFH
jgi:Vacuolar protein 14 C-terminal Fig4p binding